MRTTLKRGIGRGAELNGNGHRAVYPPGVLTPMRRYRVPPPPERTTRELFGWLFKWTLIAIVMVAAGLGGGLFLYAHETLSDFAPTHAAVKHAEKDLTQNIPDPSSPSVALLVGYDKRAGNDPLFNGSRSDTIMLVRADPQLHAVSLLSFPRDLVVPIYCKGTVVKTDRINSAWSECGPQGTVQTVEQLTGITPNYLITVDFHGFKLLVNKLNGVYMDVDHRYLNTQGGPGGYATINLHPGYQKLDGQEALDFVRFRHTDSDLYRLARQQLFVTALKERLTNGFSFLKVLHIIGALKGNVEIAQGGGGAIGETTALSYLKFARGLPSGHFFRDKIDNLTGYDTLTAPQSSVDAAVSAFEHPDVQAPQAANRAALGLKPAKPKTNLEPAQITTLVLNGTTIPGLARDTSYKLAVQGFHTLQLAADQPANAPTQDYIQTAIYYDPSQANARLAAKQLQQAFRGSVIGPITPELAPFAQSSGSPMTVVVLGSSFDGDVATATTPPSAVPKHEPPNVFSSPGTTLPALRTVSGRVPFPVMVPHVLEKESSLAQLEPVRVYKPAPHRTGLVLTFATGPGNVYWQIEETDWSDAPILAGATVSHTFGGRHFDFYYSGSHLHMVVLRTSDATYWVVNTLLDELSNETMIAIARGLAPLSQ